MRSPPPGLKAAGADGGVIRSLAIRVGCQRRNDGRRWSSPANRHVACAPPRALPRARSPDVRAPQRARARRRLRIRRARRGRLRGSERMREEAAGASFLMSPTAFFQTNVRAAEVLVQPCARRDSPRSQVLDLYAGGGLFAIPLALAGHDVMAVEENRAAVADGEAALRLNPAARDRCRFIARRRRDGARIDSARRRRGPRPSARGLFDRGSADLFGASAAGTGGLCVMQSRSARP